MRSQCNVRNFKPQAGGIRWVAAALCVGALALLWEAQRLGLGRWEQPGPGFFPAGLGAALLLCGGGLWLSASARVDVAGAAVPSRVIATGRGLLCFAGMAPLCGWVAAMVACMLATTWGDRRWRWPQRLGYALGCGLLGWLVFGMGLGVPWPAWPRLG